MDGRELKLFEERTAEAQALRDENRFLRHDRDRFRRAAYASDRRVVALEARVGRLAAENRRLRQRVRELTDAAAHPAAAGASPGAPAGTPGFAVKASVVRRGRRRRRPGRRPGHPAAHRPPPARIDVHRDVPLPTDAGGRECCPRCNCSLSGVRGRERLVEDLVPATLVVTCFHTRSGWCAACRRRVESRAPEQPPAGFRGRQACGQLGLNALATAAVLRVSHRLPFRQVSRVLADPPGLTVCPGAVARQVQRLAGWLAPYYRRIQLALRSSPHVYADETGWRTDGKNGQLWALTDGRRHTLYHVDESRAGTVIERLLGQSFDGTLGSDFYAAYNRMRHCRKQRCLAHLLRELKRTAEKHPTFAAGAFRRRAVRLVRDMLALKRRWDDMGDDRYTTRACRIEDRLARLAKGTYDEPHAIRLAKRLRRYERELTTFLWDRELDGTNNAAERAIRPAVVARKISGGSRSAQGAAAWAQLASLMRTAGQQGLNVLAVVKQLLVEHWAGGPALALTSGP